MSSTINDQILRPADQKTLLDVAEQSIERALETRCMGQLDAGSYSARLQQVQSSFVTLRIGDELRGCVGSIEAKDPLVVDVASNAFRAAFQDVRFPALCLEEFLYLSFHISVLSPMLLRPTRSLADAIGQVRPGIHGVLLRLGSRVATFLPGVWETLPDPEQFFGHLRRKAGLDPDRWQPGIQVWTYTTQQFSRGPRSDRVHSRDVG